MVTINYIKTTYVGLKTVIAIVFYISLIIKAQSNLVIFDKINYRYNPK